jgi:hypothetical protein
MQNQDAGIAKMGTGILLPLVLKLTGDNACRTKYGCNLYLKNLFFNTE